MTVSVALLGPQPQLLGPFRGRNRSAPNRASVLLDPVRSHHARASRARIAWTRESTVGSREKHAGFARHDRLERPATAAGDDRSAGGLRLDRGHPEILDRRQDQSAQRRTWPPPRRRRRPGTRLSDRHASQRLRRPPVADTLKGRPSARRRRPPDRPACAARPGYDDVPILWLGRDTIGCESLDIDRRVDDGGLAAVSRVDPGGDRPRVGDVAIDPRGARRSPPDAAQAEAQLSWGRDRRRAEVVPVLEEEAGRAMAIADERYLARSGAWCDQALESERTTSNSRSAAGGTEKITG